MMVRPAQNRTREQAAYLEQLIQSDETIAIVFRLAQDFGHLLRKHEGQEHLDQWKAAVRASGVAELITFVDGLDDDEEAVANGCSLPWSNGMVEGFVNKVKWILPQFLWTSRICATATPCSAPPSSRGIIAERAA